MHRPGEGRRAAQSAAACRVEPAARAGSGGHLDGRCRVPAGRRSSRGCSSRRTTTTSTVDKAIGTLGGQTVVDRCFQGATEFCPSGHSRCRTRATSRRSATCLLNVNKQVTKGIDIEAAYRFGMGSAGNLDVRLLGTIVNDLITVDSAGSDSSVPA